MFTGPDPARARGRVGAVKVDVEGYEAHVFWEAGDLLGSASAPLVVFEFCDWAEGRAVSRTKRVGSADPAGRGIRALEVGRVFRQVAGDRQTSYGRVPHDGGPQVVRLPFTHWIRGSRAGVGSVLAVFCAASVVLGCFAAVSDIFTDHNLMPLFMFRDSGRIYLEPNRGPMLTTIYSPLSCLLYAPAVLFHSPRTVFFAAGS